MRFLQLTERKVLPWGQSKLLVQTAIAPLSLDEPGLALMVLRTFFIQLQNFSDCFIVLNPEKRIGITDDRQKT